MAGVCIAFTLKIVERGVAKFVIGGRAGSRVHVGGRRMQDEGLPGMVFIRYNYENENILKC